MNNTNTADRPGRVPQSLVPHIIVIVAFAALASGCATVPPPTPLAEVQTVDVEISSNSIFDPQVPVERDPQYHVGMNAGGGAAAGAMAGIECGPLLVICSPFGAIVGAASGAIYGAAAGAMTSLPVDQAEGFNEVSANYFQTRDLGNDVKRAAELEVVSRHKLLTPRNPDALVSLSISELEWVIGAGDTVRLRCTISTRVSWAGGILERNYNQGSARLKVEQWIEDDGAMIGTELDTLIKALVLEIVEDLEGTVEA